MAFNTRAVKGVKESTATLMVAVLSSIITTTLPAGTLKSFLDGTKWNEDDIRRLEIID